MKKLIAVFGPSNCVAGEKLFEGAESLGQMLASAGFTVVTGGYDGVMEAASKGARKAGGSTIGITAEVYYARGREANLYLSKEIRVKSATDRLMELLDLPDAWCAMGNSTGTLAEVAMAWDYLTKEFIERKPLLLIGESWKRFEAYLDGESQFAPCRDFIEFYASVDEAMNRLIEVFGKQPQIPDLEVIGQ